MTPAWMARALDNSMTVLTMRVYLALPFLATGLSKLVPRPAAKCADRTASQTLAETAEQ